MLLTIAMVFLVLWFLALGLFHVTGGFVHILVVVAMVCVGWNLMGRHREVA